jgi:hypothetical protein
VTSPALVPALLIALALVAAGWLVGDGFARSRLGDRYVTVKGIAEREVKADLALWPLRFVATGNDLEAARGEIASDADAVRHFLERAGTKPAEIELSSLEVTDLYANPYRSGPVQSRFILAQTLLVRSADVDRVGAASQRVAELVDAGVILSSDGAAQGGRPHYLFTRLVQIKPEMIAEATRNAREAAAQFAADSGSAVGGIRTASQGLFEILGRDAAAGMQPEQQVQKTVRVVTTIQYSLVE